jgi:hypothetical protein
VGQEFVRFLKTLDTPAFVRKPAVAVFDAHEERDGGRLVRRFTKASLERIAANCNRRERAGTLCPITIGHTDPDDPNEKNQPEHVGYARRFRVAYSRQLGRHVILADFYLKKSKAGEAMTYPRVSVELWPSDQFLDPIALLRRTPQRDLGQWHYGKGPPAAASAWSYSRSTRAGRFVLRYSMSQHTGASMHEDEELMDDGADVAPEAAPGAPAELSHEEKAEEFMKHCFSHPHAQHFAKHYAMPAEEAPLEEEAPPAEPAHDPAADAPDAEADPEQYGMAAPGATNGALPGAEGPDRFAKRDRARLERARSYAKALRADNYVFDEQKVVARFAKMGPREAKEYDAEARACFARAPVGGERVPTKKNEHAGKGGKRRPLWEMTESEKDRALLYMKRRAADGKPVSFEKAADRIMNG